MHSNIFIPLSKSDFQSVFQCETTLGDHTPDNDSHSSAPLKVLPVAICLILLTACSSDTDSITLGNGLETQVGAANSTDTDTQTQAEAQAPSTFLGDAPIEEDDSADNSTQVTDTQAATLSSPGIGGAPQPQQQPLNDTSQSETVPAIGEANSADGDTGLDLSNDILIPPEAPVLAITATAAELVFSWDLPVAGAEPEAISFEIDQYNSITRESINLVRALESTTTSYQLPIIPHEFDWDSTEFILGICTENDCLRSFNTAVADLQSNSIGRVRGTGGEEFDLFGSSLAVAANGKVLVAGKPGHDVDASAIDENVEDSISETDDDFSETEEDAAGGIFDAGAAELFFEVENEWFAAAELGVTNPGFNSQLGFSVAADSSGDTIVVGAPADSSNLDLAGGAYVYIRLGETWVQSATLVPGQARAFAGFGHSVAISDDGTLIAVGAPGDSNSTIDPFAPIETAPDAGSVSLFRFDQTTGSWSLSDYVRSPSIDSGQRFGQAISLSEAADTMVVAAPGERASEERAMPGVVHILDIEDAGVFNRQQLFQLASSQQDPELSGFGSAIAISADGDTVLATCLNRPATSSEFVTQLNKPQTELVVYDLTNNAESGLDSFTEQRRLIPAGEHGYDTRLSVAMTADGSKIAAGLLNSSTGSNTVTVFRRPELSGELSATAGWEMVNSFAPPDEAANFGTSVEFSTDGTRLFIGADEGVDGGIVYIY